MKDNFRTIYKEKNLTIKFIIIGGIGFVCNFIVLKSLINGAGFNRIVAEVFAAIVALQVTFILHDKWTYKINKSTHKYHLTFGKRYRAYLVSNSFASILTVIFFAIFSFFLPHFPALALSALSGLIWNFFLNKKVIWHHKPHVEDVNKNDSQTISADLVK